MRIKVMGMPAPWWRPNPKHRIIACELVRPMPVHWDYCYEIDPADWRYLTRFRGDCLPPRNKRQRCWSIEWRAIRPLISRPQGRSFDVVVGSLVMWGGEIA